MIVDEAAILDGKAAILDGKAAIFVILCLQTYFIYNLDLNDKIQISIKLSKLYMVYVSSSVFKLKR